MRIVESTSELADLLFEEMDESKPRQIIDSGFVVRLAGLCFGVIYGGADGNPPYLEDTMSIHYDDGQPTRCGKKLIELSERLVREDVFNPRTRLTSNKLVRMMLDVLNSEDIELRPHPESGGTMVVSSVRYEQRRQIKIRVMLEPA